MNTAPLRAIRSFLLDMDGTIYLGHSPIPGAVDFVRYLQKSGRKHLFFTNNSSADAAYCAEKLCAMKIDALPSHIFTSGEATALYLMSKSPYRRVFAVGAPSFEEELRAQGLIVTDEEPDVVVLAFDKTLTYAKLERACLLLRQGLPYLATNPDKVCPTDYGYLPDCGSMAALLFEATGRRPKFIGKPHSEMARMGLEKLDATAETTAIVGDRLYTDMQMAYDAGITAILVLSGETQRDDLDKPLRKPDFVFESVANLLVALREVDSAS